MRRVKDEGGLIVFCSTSLDETIKFGTSLAGCLRQGDVVAFIGELGAGKTHLVQAIATALGADVADVSSPTFVLIQEYDTVVPVVHIDAYRLADEDEFLELGADELLGADNICLIEWADRVMQVLPKRRIEIRIEATGENSRRIAMAAEVSRLNDVRVRLFDNLNSAFVDG